MRSHSPQFHVATVFSGLLMASTLCSASPQQDRGRRESPQPVRPMVERASPEISRPDNPRSVAGPTTDRMDRMDRHPGPRTREVDPRPEALAPRVSSVGLYPGTRVVVPPAWHRCTTFPTGFYWRQRDLMAEIQWLSRRGFVPVTALGDTVEALTDYVQVPSGWRAYGVSVPAGGTVQIEVQHSNLGWFRLMLVDKWGRPGPGMLQAAIAPQPILVTYKNPGKEATAVYVIVDDPAWWSDAKNPYTLVLRRDWDPARVDLSGVKMVAGLWGASPSVSAEFRGPSLTGPAVFPH
ncbi:hypothetical protein GETHED_06740 [Geothrix edaphica]|uniref:DUF4832 domain-containing protein n=2 Tax=Geothrix edaphica TaxID=2927976 RepID=A0ABQ5PV33_9BACT|nr:hypothetical protein GETHED_06740 [Geothrix edaphica]